MIPPSPPPSSASSSSKSPSPSPSPPSHPPSWPSRPPPSSPPAVTLLESLDPRAVRDCLARYGASLVLVPAGAPIPCSYWGEPEAGLEGSSVFARADTPAHSLLHELGHFVCMSGARRRGLRRDAGGDADEECAVCCLQVLLADVFPELGRRKALDDMDSWGYGFREGSARAWWRGDARFARAWLRRHGVIDPAGGITWRLRE